MIVLLAANPKGLGPQRADADPASEPTQKGRLNTVATRPFGAIMMVRCPHTPCTLRRFLEVRPFLVRRLSTQGDLVEIVRSGLPQSSLAAVMEVLHLSSDSLSSAIALPKRTLSRRKKQDRLTADESDRLMRLARIAAHAVSVFGDSSKASNWLKKPNRALGNVSPLSQMDTEVGARMVEQVLGRIEYGVFS